MMNETLSKEELEVLIALINSQQFDGAQWAINNVWLTPLKKKLKKIIKEK